MDNDFFDSIENVRGGIFGALKDKQHKGFKDCCEEYKFIRRSNTISFNNKMNRLGITHLVLDEEYDQTDVLFEDLIEPIKYGASTSIGVTGYTRSGKSELVQTMVQILKKANEKYRKRTVELYLCWDQPQFYTILKKIKKGDIVWRDEDPRPIGKGSRVETWAVDNILHAIAKMENNFIFVDPKRIKSDICDLYLESAGMNRQTRINRFMILDDEKHYFGHIYVKLHDDDAFRKWYEHEKDLFIQDSIDKGGKFKSLQEDQDIEQEEITENIREEYELLKAIYKSTFKERDLMIWKLRKEGKSFDELSKIFGLVKGTIKNIYYNDIESLLKE
ncbi:MAG: hypothetical protein ACFFDF_13855 [Candidatus Odinarchaeota archaeon]